jgi:AbrB family looped-hinge helix DNA binding protein
MKIGERGQVAIPKSIREQFGPGPETGLEFRVVNGPIVLKNGPRKLDLGKWKGRCAKSFSEPQSGSHEPFQKAIMSI